MKYFKYYINYWFYYTPIFFNRVSIIKWYKYLYHGHKICYKMTIEKIHLEKLLPEEQLKYSSKSIVNLTIRYKEIENCNKFKRMMN